MNGEEHLVKDADLLNFDLLNVLQGGWVPKLIVWVGYGLKMGV
jgi:hypothetical protein